MGTVCFDFDSTLVGVESLEVLCARAADLDAHATRTLARITEDGMAGRLDFEASLRQRLELARPRRDDVARLGAELARAPSQGAGDLVARLAAAGHAVWIVSGGLRDLLLVVGGALGLPAERVRGVSVTWDADGVLAALVPDGFERSKVEGLRRLGIAFDRPAVGVGDGVTDLALRTAGFVDTFVAYTEHARRPAVTAPADHEARDMAALGPLLESLLP